MRAKPQTIDDYLAGVSPEQRETLQQLRQRIQTAAPKAEEGISYGLAAFRLDGKPLVAFGASTSHCAFYPMSSTTIGEFQDQLKDYETSKGTIRFPADKPLPAGLVKTLVKARIAENAAFRKLAKRTTTQRDAKDVDAEAVITALKRLATKHTLEGMARFALPSDKAFGVSVADMRKLAKQLGRNHELAAALWDTGWYEARMLASMVDDPAQVTPTQMDRWCKDFDNWGIVDTVCFTLFDRTPHAFKKVEQWASRQAEFEKRAAFALLWSLTTHAKHAADDQFLRGLELIEAAAMDDRNFVKKAVNMALRTVGKRNAALHTAALEVARRLAASSNATARWNGKDALRELKSDSVSRRLKAKTDRTRKSKK